MIVSLRPSANGGKNTLNKCETQNEIVFHIRLRHPETINSVPLNSVLRIRQRDVQPILHIDVTYFRIAHTVNKTSSKHHLHLMLKAMYSPASKNAKQIRNTRLRHPETILSVPLNSVLRIKQTGV